MNGEQLKALESKLWETADQLRANSKLTATEYSFPILGLIFLRHAFSRYTRAKAELEASKSKKSRFGVKLKKEDFTNANAMMLPEVSQWTYISEQPESADLGEILDEAMRAIEAEHESLLGVLPKGYNLFDNELLQSIVRIFNTELLDNVTGDVFGRIYEYFLNKFAMKGAQEGGEFFTPPSLVNAIVNIIEPKHGNVFDPACGSAGMFVQTGHFLEEANLKAQSEVTFYGQEKADQNTKLAKMNMVVHGFEAKILQGNTFYQDEHSDKIGVGGADYVMANPPFNVDGVDKNKDFVKKDERLPFGLPKNDNANYLWIQYFYAYLNQKGRAGFVMASSASDAGHSEKTIRQKIVETGAVDVMVSIGPKFFYTRSLPCSIWFFDRAKENDKVRADQTLMFDLREVYRKVSSNLHDFTNEHLRNIRAVVALYRGDSTPLNDAVADYQSLEKSNVEGAQRAYGEILGLMGKETNQDSWTAEDAKSEKRHLNNEVKTWLATQKDSLKGADKTLKASIQKAMKEIEVDLKAFNELADQAYYFHKEILWLTSRFPDGKYTDVPGLCKVVSRDEIAENDFSLTPGRYVGVAPIDEGDFDYEERMGEIKQELSVLNAESVELAEAIQTHLEELGL